MSSEFKEKYKEFLGPTSTQVLYVTEEIKCKYHPFTNLSEILDHYYPLEITANDGFINGVEKKCTVEELSLE
ncbi:hypothetical protein MWU65_02100 [Cellulophaga sp. F20128]|uniref:hypothetical protein n=1 Tax=Cellulophaga sp. F20128 TaxID=2926413 RepID=UPI001FF651FD|nr:hypothetical protein [Cellulophaga sp. F20128]MCK0155953.1 hypothetical protein [Cellulophaga sp. F20128]